MESMQYTRGPVRLILINSGVYDYAEIELDRPLHLVGPNNSGKTTLISALQFLYVDSFNEMSFSYGSRKTREYYFPSSRSFILFECLTPDEYRVVGVRGLGELESWQFQRFTYRGTYRREDFLEDRSVRKWKQIRSALIGRDLQDLDAGQLREGLLDSGRGELDLGLVPLENDGRYKSFSFIFKNLLRLADLKRGDFKKLLIDTNRGALGSVELDLRDQYEQQYLRIQREHESISKFAETTDDIRKLLESVDRRRQKRAELTGLWNHLQRRVVQRKDQIDEKIEGVRAKLDEVKDELEATNEKLQCVGDTRDAKLGKKAKLEDRLEQLRETEEEFHDFDPGEARQRKSELDDRLHELRNRLDDSASADRRQVERRHQRAKRKLKQDRAQLEGLSDRAISWLRRDAGFEDEEIDALFRLLNPELLRLEVRGQNTGAQLRDETLLRRRLAELHRGFDHRGYRDESVEIADEQLSGDSAVESFGDPDRIKARIQQLEKQKEECEQTLRDIDRRETLETHRDETKKMHENVSELLVKWKELQKRLRQRQSWREQLRVLGDELDELNRESDQLDERRKQLRDSRAELQNKRDTLKQARNKLERRLRGVTPPEASWDVETAEENEQWRQRELDDIFDLFERRRDQLDELDDQIANLDHDVARATDETYSGPTFEETLENLRDQLEAIDQRRSSLENQWEALVENLTGELKQLDNGLQSLSGEIQRLNRHLNRRQISDLKSVKLKVERREQIVDKIHQVIQRQEQPLFSSANQAKEATRFVANLLEDYGRLQLEELFDLVLVVEKASGEREKSTGLERIESHGTTTTIKVLVHLQLLEMMLIEDKAFIPFFLDEVSRLDDQNLGAIIEHATDLNFVPIVASPDAGDCVGRLYLLQSGGGEGVWLDEQNRLDIEPVDPGEAAYVR